MKVRQLIPPILQTEKLQRLLIVVYSELTAIEDNLQCEGYDVTTVTNIMSKFPDVVDIQVFGCKLLSLASNGTCNLLLSHLELSSLKHIQRCAAHRWRPPACNSKKHKVEIDKVATSYF